MSQVTTEYSGGGDPRRSIELLWAGRVPLATQQSAEPGRGARRGPKPRLTVDQITAAAIRVADAEGLSALSMRRIADELRVAPMSLYTYVPGKAELIDLMVDAALGESLPSGPDGEVPISERPNGDGPDGGDWRSRLEAVARGHWARYHRHPWMLHVTTHRPVLGPNLIATYDRELRTVDGIGLSDIEMDSVISLVTGYVQSAARASVEATRLERTTGQSDAEWWESHAPLLEQVLDPDRYPLATRVGTAAGEAYQSASAPALQFEFGLTRILDGIAVLVASRRPR